MQEARNEAGSERLQAEYSLNEVGCTDAVACRTLPGVAIGPRRPRNCATNKPAFASSYFIPAGAMQINAADVSRMGQDRTSEFIRTPAGAVEQMMMNVAHGLIVPP